MKIVDDDMLQKLKANSKIRDDDSDNTIPFFSEGTNLEYLEQYDKIKSRVLKYVLYKKRSEQEIRTKFSKEIPSEMLDSIINDLKKYDYIDDTNYIKRSINEFMALKTLSKYEIKNKLIAKGIKADLIDDYFSKNEEELNEFELNSCIKLIKKNINSKDEKILIDYLYRKGYSQDTIKLAIVLNKLNLDYQN